MKILISMVLIVMSVNVYSDSLTDLDSNLADKYAVYAMMASNAYLGKEDRTYFPIEKLGWIRVGLDGRPTEENSYTPSRLGKWFSSLQYDIWEHKEKPLTVISFKGADEKVDWLNANFWVGISIPYKSAKKHVKEYIKDHEERNVVLVGHSLGGGIALSVSVWEGIDAYVFNSSPRIYDGYADHNEPAIRKAVYQRGEILEKLRSRWPKFLKKIPTEDIIRTDFEYGEKSKHRADYIAEGILRCASNDPELAEIAKQIPEKITCNF